MGLYTNNMPPTGPEQLNRRWPTWVGGEGDVTHIYVSEYLKLGFTFEEAMKGVNAEIKKRVRSSPYNDNKIVTCKVFLPAGTFYISTPEAFIEQPEDRTCGLVIEGCGVDATEIVYKPPENETFFWKNLDGSSTSGRSGFLFLTIRDVTFICDAGDKTETGWMLSESSGGPQNYVFERVNWKGWVYGLHLIGDNNNSEMSWFHCGIYGDAWESFLWMETSDQFCNYNFYATQFEVYQGTMIRAQMGGSIFLRGGSLIHTGGGGVFFSLEGSGHAWGTTNFRCEGVRFETRTDDSSVIDCSWGDGNVAFVNCNNATSAREHSEDWVCWHFDCGNQKGPNVLFDSCCLIGKIQIDFTYNTFDYPHNFYIQNCEFAQLLNDGNDTPLKEPTDYVIFNSYDSGTEPNVNLGGNTVVHFVNCRHQSCDAEYAFWDCDIGLSTAARGYGREKIASVKYAAGCFPAGTVDGQPADEGTANVNFTLPLGSVITKIFMASNNTEIDSENTFRYTVQTREDTPTVLIEVITNPQQDGGNIFNKTETMFYVCDTDAKRKLTLHADESVDWFDHQAVCWVYYI